MFREAFELASRMEENSDPRKQLILRQAKALLIQGGIAEPPMPLKLERVGFMIYKLRTLNGESQESLADRAGMAAETLSRTESLYTSPRVSSILLWAEALAVSASCLFGETGTLPNPQTTQETVGRQLSGIVKIRGLDRVAREANLSPDRIRKLTVYRTGCTEQTLLKLILSTGSPPSYFFDEQKDD